MKLIERGDDEFPETLDMLQKRYFHNGGCEEAEVIVSWHKREIKENGWISLYATNSTISSAIKRCRAGIRAVRYDSQGAELFIDKKSARPLHTVLKIRPE